MNFMKNLRDRNEVDDQIKTDRLSNIIFHLQKFVYFVNEHLSNFESVSQTPIDLFFILFTIMKKSIDARS